MSAQPLPLNNIDMNSLGTKQCTSIPERLIADIGGTNARFALLSPKGVVHQQIVLPCADYPDIVSAVKAYLSQIGNPHIEEAAMAI